MDGYAVCSDDIKHARSDSAVSLKIIGEIQAGNESTVDKLCSGNCIRIMTGAPVPEGADSVVPFEDTVEIIDNVQIFKKTAQNENIRFAGETFKKGDIVLKSGTKIDSAQIGLISSLNLKDVYVHKKPKVAIISSGDELAEPGDYIPGKIINSNAYVLFSEIIKYGGEPIYGGIVKDRYEDVKNIFLKLLDNDIIISSGGVSMGRYDFIPDVLKDIGIDIKVHKVMMKPGKPVVFGINGEKAFFGLPGNPVSTMVSFMQFVRPAILKMSGNKKISKPLLKAKIKEDINKEKGKKYFIRGFFNIENGNFYAKTTGPQGSGIISSMSNSNCLIVIPEEIESVKSGDYVDIQLINHSEI